MDSLFVCMTSQFARIYFYLICLVTISNIKNDYFWFEHMVFMRSRKSMYTGFSVLLPAGTKCPPEWYNDWHFVLPNRDNRSSLILVPITLSSLPITCNVGIIDSSNMVGFVELWINSIAYIWSNWTKNSKRIFKAKR